MAHFPTRKRPDGVLIDVIYERIINYFPDNPPHFLDELKIDGVEVVPNSISKPA